MFSVSEYVGAAIRQARKAQGVSLRHLAGQLGVSPPTLSAIETGQTPLTVDRLQQVSALLDVPAARLLRGPSPAMLTPQPPVGQPRDWRDFRTITMSPILEAATRVFVAKGFHAASMRDIATEAGLSAPGIYHHHPSKEHLLASILDVTISEIQWRIEAACEEGDTPVAKYALMVEALALFHAVRGDLAFLGASEMRGLTGRARERAVAMRNRVQHTMDAQASACISTGDFSCPDPHTVGRAVSTLCTSLPSWFRTDGPLSAQEIAHRYARLALRMMGADSDLDPNEKAEV